MRPDPSQWFLPQLLVKAKPWEMIRSPTHCKAAQGTEQENTPNPAGNLPIQIAAFFQGNFSAAVPGVPLLMRQGDVNTRAVFKLLIPPQIHQRGAELPKPVDSQLMPCIFHVTAVTATVLGQDLSLVGSPWEHQGGLC